MGEPSFGVGERGQERRSLLPMTLGPGDGRAYWSFVKHARGPRLLVTLDAADRRAALAHGRAARGGAARLVHQHVEFVDVAEGRLRVAGLPGVPFQNHPLVAPAL